mgnify:CR=1 FL=1
MVQLNQQKVIEHLKELIQLGTDSFEQWVRANPIATSEILKAHYQLFLTEILQGEIVEFEE